MKWTRWSPAWISACAALFAGPAPASAQGYPSRTITFVMPFAAGGPGDTMARVFAQSMSKAIGQQIIVENVGGAGGTTGVARVAAATPDGYTVVLHHMGMATAPAMYANLKYDALKDFAPIGMLVDNIMVFVARKDFPAKDFGEYLTHLKANGEKLTWGHAGIGSSSHLCGVLLLNTIGANIRHVSYRGSGPALNDLITGQIDFMCDQPINVISNAQAGNIKAYAVTASKSHPSMPSLPPVTQFSADKLVVTNWLAMYAPKRTPKEAIAKLSSALQAATDDADVRKRMADLGIDVVSRDRATPEYLGKFIADATALWVPLLKNAGVVPQ